MIITENSISKIPPNITYGEFIFIISAIINQLKTNEDKRIVINILKEVVDRQSRKKDLYPILRTSKLALITILQKQIK